MKKKSYRCYLACVFVLFLRLSRLPAFAREGLCAVRKRSTRSKESCFAGLAGGVLSAFRQGGGGRIVVPCRAESVSVLCGKYSSTLRRVQSGTPRSAAPSACRADGVSLFFFLPPGGRLVVRGGIRKPPAPALHGQMQAGAILN